MIETHAHIYDQQFEVDREDMLRRAQQAGVEEIWMPNCNLDTIPKMLALESAFCLPMMGLHPCYVDNHVESSIAGITKYLEERPFFMIGEIGLDYYWDLQYVQEQEWAFVRQLELAQKYQLPICIHSRNSKNGEYNAIIRCCELIEEHGHPGLRGIFHCFSGNLKEAQRVISLNFLLGIGGVATFKNGGLDAVLPYVSLENIVLETDSPYLAPVPYRGKRNEVAYVELVADRVALLMASSRSEVVQQTSKNARFLRKNYSYVH